MDRSTTSCPYKGLMPFTEAEEDAVFFFGRERDQRLITSNLFAARLTTLYGASGVGKSSVLRAGVVYHLRQAAALAIQRGEKPDLAVVLVNEWQGDPLAQCKRAIVGAVTTTLGATAPVLSDHVGSLGELIKAATDHLEGDLMVILDQFEEYFLYHAQDDGPGSFAVEFAEAVNQTRLPVSFLVSIREDALSKLDRFKGSIPNLFANYLRIEHLDREAARAAIEKPIEQYNRLHSTDGPEIGIEAELVDAVLGQVEAGQVLLGTAGRGVVQDEAGSSRPRARIETPFLQLVLTYLWDEEMRANSPRLRLETLTRLGGAERIVQTHLSHVMSTLAPSEQDTVARVFRYLVTPSGTKIAHRLSDLADYAEVEQGQLKPVLDKLCDRKIYILRSFDPSPDRQAMSHYEIFHDVLAKAILDWRAQYTQGQLWRQSRPWAYIRDLSTGQGYLLKDEIVSIGRTAPWWHNHIDLPWGYVSRIHLMISRNLLALDMHSTNGTTVNAQFHPYGPPKQLETGDIIVLAGIAPLQFHTIEYSDLEYPLDALDLLPPPAVEESSAPRGWALLIDGGSKAATSLDSTRYYLALDEHDRIVVREERAAQTFLMIQRWDREWVLFEYQHDHGFLLATFKAEVSRILLPDEPFDLEVKDIGMWSYTHRKVCFQIVPIEQDSESTAATC